MSDFPEKVTLADIEYCFGVDKSELSDAFMARYEQLNLHYRRPGKEERDGIILEVLRKIESDKQKIAAKERKDVWHNGWQENLDAFRASGGDFESLTPKFIRHGQPIRFRGDYIIPENNRFEYDFLRLFQYWLFEKYLKDCSEVYEFGCGTGLNLELISKIFPDKTLHGLDFVQSSVDLIDEIHRYHDIKVSGHLFDMTQPDQSLIIREGAGVFTFGSLEQLAGNIQPILAYFLASKAKIFLHVEPTIEKYDENRLFDFLAMKFHSKRGYSQGLVATLEHLHEQGTITLEQIHRLNFGSLFMEGYTLYVWHLN
ncbi:hypothetical protein MAQ5080_00259 [Marinomonas aquimarina]|uniref:Methyltransferase domain protein n=1 Tax=Marinomonas aquimarina TaxID=295068 RepID=A0A1A8T0L9_9GAMM|nr:class I SAM-dependent methyltransferase [Marinomonas aquimarina]SBS25419.1 hypothetical protein MAQ5080_00259 [Marinomonas aquimarina]